MTLPTLPDCCFNLELGDSRPSAWALLQRGGDLLPGRLCTEPCSSVSGRKQVARVPGRGDGGMRSGKLVPNPHELLCGFDTAVQEEIAVGNGFRQEGRGCLPGSSIP